MQRVSRFYWAILVVVVLLWVAGVIVSGAGWNIGDVDWDFSNPGAFGDSFGPLGTAMAAIAALSAVATLRSQQEELNRIREREGDEDARAQKLAFESTFFQLLRHHQANVSSIDIGSSSGHRAGQDAFRSMVYFLSNQRAPGLQHAWDQTYKKYRNDLGHYFRFLYHLFKYTKEEGGEKAYFYARLVRSALSESELILLAVSCIYGEGREKFYDYVVEFSLLHNLSEGARKTFIYEGAYPAQAFEASKQTA